MTVSTQSYASGTSDVPLIGSTIGAQFDAAVDKWGDRDALIVREQDVHWTWSDLKQWVDDFAAGLIDLGLQPGDRIGIWSPNNSEWAITQFATAKAGLILVNINPAYRVAELEYALNKVGCVALVTAAAFKTSDYLGMIRELASELDGAEPGELNAAKLPHRQPGSPIELIGAFLPKRTGFIPIEQHLSHLKNVTRACIRTVVRKITDLASRSL